jgi:3-mercaptopyruvate sulfurtransferase SseA
MDNVVNLMGGITDWQASGHPVARDAPADTARRVA